MAFTDDQERLERALAAAVEEEDWDLYFDTAEDLRQLCASEAFQALHQTRFSDAATLFSRSQELADDLLFGSKDELQQRLVHVEAVREQGGEFHGEENDEITETVALDANHTNRDDTTRELALSPVIIDNIDARLLSDQDMIATLQRNMSTWEQDSIIMGAHKYFCDGLMRTQNRNHGASCADFQRSRDLFLTAYDRTGVLIYRFFAETCGALEELSKGLEEASRGSLTQAKSSLQRARSRLKRILNALVIEEKDREQQDMNVLRNLAEANIEECERIYDITSAKGNLMHGRYDEAAERFIRSAERLRQNITRLESVISATAMNLLQSQYRSLLGEAHLAQGEHCRLQEQWDDALKYYYDALNDLEEAAAIVVDADTSYGFEVQERLNNQAARIPELYIRRCEKERLQHNKIRTLEQQIESLLESTRRVGITVNNSQEMVSVVEQNFEFVQRLEVQARESIEELVGKLEEVPLEKNDRERIQRKASGLVTSKDRGVNFLKQVAELTDDLKKVMENVGDVAKPLLPLAGALAGIAQIAG